MESQSERSRGGRGDFSRRGSDRGRGRGNRDHHGNWQSEGKVEREDTRDSQ